MRTNLLALGIASLMVIAPAASATGWLVNVGIGGSSMQFGSNLFGGQGDTLDVGLFNHQCTDEDDVVDVGVANREGDAQCGYTEGCHADEGEDVLGPIFGSDKESTHPHDPHCSDDGDTVDVSLLNAEGGEGYSREAHCTQQSEEPGSYPRGGDQEDGVDVGALNWECYDDDDAADVGVVNCELWDRDDGIDGGVLNGEYHDDSSDTFDLSLFNTEWNDGPDRNGLNVFAWLGFELGCVQAPTPFADGLP